MGVNICAVSCDMGYEADLPDFICGELPLLVKCIYLYRAKFVSKVLSC